VPGTAPPDSTTECEEGFGAGRLWPTDAMGAAAEAAEEAICGGGGGGGCVKGKFVPVGR